MILSKLSPAETLILRYSDKVELKELLKFTLMDLLLKQVLTIHEVERQPHWRHSIRVYKYISTGKNFHGYAGAHHEQVFLSGFNLNAGRRILFRNLVRVAYENAGTEQAFKKSLLGSQELQNAFKTSLMQKLFLGGFDYTSHGRKLKIEVEKEILELEEKIPDHLLNDKTRALEYLRLIGGNVFLLRGIEFALLKEIEAEILKELTNQESKRSTTSGCSTGGCWTTFDDHGGDFDNSCSANTSSGWGSGCSGDGGCSGGDSGCGGCGVD